MTKKFNIAPQYIISLVLIGVTLIVYVQVVNHDFTNYDDPTYVTQNREVQKGLTLETISWAFTTGYGANWHPLTWVSHMVDIEIFGLQPWGHHLVNLLFHIANTVLLFLVLKRMTGAIWASAFVAALFALHPLHVESVAWIAERKDVLSTFFWMLTMYAYVRYAEKPGLKTYVPIVAFLALGLLSKPMLVTLPFVLLLMDFWPLRRFRSEQSVRTGKGFSQKLLGIGIDKTIFYRLIREKIPLFALIIGSSVVTFFVQQEAGAVGRIDQFGLGLRLGNALISYVRYLGKMIWPSGLGVFYPYELSQPGWMIAGATVVLLGITLVVIRELERRPYLAVGWLWYVGTLVPVIGLVQVGSQSVADRYTYIPLIGIFIMFAWGIPDIWLHSRFRRVALPAGAGGVLSVLSVLTWVQVSHWRDGITLMQHTASVTSNNWIAHTNLGLSYIAQEKFPEAAENFKTALRFHSTFAEAQHGLGLALARQGKISEAIPHYRGAIKNQPDFVDAYTNLGAALAIEGQIEEALNNYEEALRLKPEHAEAHNNLGSLLAQQGKTDQAIFHFNEALRIKPDYEDARNNLKLAQSKSQDIESARPYLEALKQNPQDADAHYSLAKLYIDRGRIADAKSHLSEAVRFRSNFVDAQRDLAKLLEREGKNAEAIVYYSRALELRPNDIEMNNELGVLMGKQGRFSDAITYLNRTLRLNPNHVDAHNNLGIVFAMQGRTSEATAHFSSALRIDPNLPRTHFNLGILASRQGKVSEAIEHFSQAIRIQPDYAEARTELEKALQAQRLGQPNSRPSNR